MQTYGKIVHTKIWQNCNRMMLEMLAKHLCKIEVCVDGSKTKELGGGVGDGLILQKSVEIKHYSEVQLVQIFNMNWEK